MILKSFALFASLMMTAGAVSAESNLVELYPQSTILDELDPNDPRIEEILQQMDEEYANQTGVSPFWDDVLDFTKSTCRRIDCGVFAHVVKSEQRMYLYVDGQHVHTWLVSTGLPRSPTPNFDRHPNGRIYDRYTSTRYPGGNYMNLGNMPYAVFIHGGYAIHGTGTGNWSKLGRPASHGCIRLHPDNGLIFNRLVRQYGIYDTWITVH